MTIRYILPALALLLAFPVQAQTEAEQVDPALDIVGGDISTTISNFIYEYPSAYVLPDTSVSAIIGASLFTENNAGEVGIAPVYTEEGVVGEFVLALTDDESLSEACGDNSADNPTIGNDISGKIVFVARGTCSFTYKTEIVQELGGIGIVIFNPADRDPDTIGNMIAPGDYATILTIPTVLLPYGMAAPVVTALEGGETVNGAIRADDNAPVAIEDTPEAADLAFGAASPNPFSATTSFRMSLPEAEDITVEVFSVNGRRVATLHEGVMRAGETNVTFDAAGLPSGVYLVRATGEQFSLARPVTIIR